MPLTLRIKNYKSIEDAQIEIRPGLNILVGPNGSGKTCLLSSFRFIHDVFKMGAAQALARQGGAPRVYRHNTTEMLFSMTETYGKRTYSHRKIPCQIYWEMILAQAGEEEIATILSEKFEILGQDGDKKICFFSIKVDRRKIGKKSGIRHFLCMPSEFGRDLFSMWNESWLSKTNKKKLREMLLSPKYSKRNFDHIRSQPDRSFFPVLVDYDQKIFDISSLLRGLLMYDLY